MSNFCKKVNVVILINLLLFSYSIISNNSAANSLLIDNNNNVLLGGSFSDFNKVSGGLDFLLVRYNNNGILDNTFNPNGSQPGVVATPINNDNDFINSITLDSNNNIVAAGVSTINNLNAGTSASIAVARYLNNGELDPSFNPTGKDSGKKGVVITQIHGVNDIANGVTVDNNNRIVVVGSSAEATINSLSNIDLAVVRYDPDGSLDKTFNPQGLVSGTAGVVLINISKDPEVNISGQTNVAKAVAIDNNNKIVIAGRADNGLVVGILVVRLNEDGSLDKTFNPLGLQTNVPGTVITNINSNSEAVDLLIDKNNKILVAGTTIEDRTNQLLSQSATVTNVTSFALVRYDQDGSLDKTFNPNAVGGTSRGIVVRHFSDENNNEIATSLALDNNNKIVVTGYSQISLPNQIINPTKTGFGQIDFLTARYNSDGSNDDKTFNKNKTPGYVLTTINNNSSNTESTPTAIANSVAIDNANNIVVTGFTSNNSESDVATVRYLYSGLLDPSFNGVPPFSPGIVVTNVTNGQVPDPATLVGTTVVTDIFSLPTVNVDPLVAAEISSEIDRTQIPEILSPVSGFRTDNLGIPITGSSQPFSPVTININAQPITRTQSDQAGRWDFKLPYLDDGVYDIQAIGQEPFSEMALGSPKIQIKIDRPNLDISEQEILKEELVTSAISKTPIISEPINNAKINESFILVNGEYEPKQNIKLYLNDNYLGQTETNNQGEWNFKITDLEDGDHKLYIKASNDTSKIELQSETVSFNVQKIQKIKEKRNRTSKISDNSKETGIIFSGTLEPATKIQILLDGKKIAQTNSDSLGKWQFSFSNLEEKLKGTHKVTIVRKNPDGLYDHIMEKIVNF